MYTRLTKTWECYSAVQDLILNNIRTDLARLIASSLKLVDREQTEAPKVENLEIYKVLLRRDLQHSLDRLNTPNSKRQCFSGPLRDLSVELEGPLEPEIDDVVDSFGASQDDGPGASQDDEL